jgi:hypothetical protein
MQGVDEGNIAKHQVVERMGLQRLVHRLDCVYARTQAVVMVEERIVQIEEDGFDRGTHLKIFHKGHSRVF